MAASYKLLVRLLVGVLKHQAKRVLGEDVLTALADAGSEHLGETLLELLKGDAASRAQTGKLLVTGSAVGGI